MVDSVDDMLQLLMKNGEFHPPEAEPNVNVQYTPSEPPAPAPSVNHATTAQNSFNGDSNSIYTTASVDQNVPSQHLTLEELGIDIEAFPMDLGEDQNESIAPSSELMDVDTDWLDRWISSDISPPTNGPSSTSESLFNNNVADPLDLFNLDDNDFRLAAEFSWDRVDFAT